MAGGIVYLRWLARVSVSSKTTFAVGMHIHERIVKAHCAAQEMGSMVSTCHDRKRGCTRVMKLDPYGEGSAKGSANYSAKD